MAKDVSHEVPRPEPTGTSKRGNFKVWRGEDLRIFRLKSMCTQNDIGGYLRMVQTGVQRWEELDEVQEKFALPYMSAVERVVGNRAKLLEEGLAREAGTWVSPRRVRSMDGWRTQAEADKIKDAQREQTSGYYTPPSDPMEQFRPVEDGA